jgi:Domain of unknown function (DUF2760)
MAGFWKRVGLAFQAFSSILTDGQLPEEVSRELAPALPAAPAAATEVQPARPEAEPVDRAVQMLALLQRDGRLIDFLSEDIASYPDAQIGTAVRTVHESCRDVLQRYFKLEPIVDSQEDQAITVQSGFDPASIKLMGNVTGAPPIRGILRHRGWRVKEASLPSLPQGAGRMVVAPAEVEVP